MVRAFLRSGVSSEGTYFWWGEAFALPLDFDPFRRDSWTIAEGSASSSESDLSGSTSAKETVALDGDAEGDSIAKSSGALCDNSFFPFDFFSFFLDFSVFST